MAFSFPKRIRVVVMYQNSVFNILRTTIMNPKKNHLHIHRRSVPISNDHPSLFKTLSLFELWLRVLHRVNCNNLEEPKLVLTTTSGKNTTKNQGWNLSCSHHATSQQTCLLIKPSSKLPQLHMLYVIIPSPHRLQVLFKGS